MALSKFEDYGGKYKHIKMERRDGILQMTLHTNDAELTLELAEVDQSLVDQQEKLARLQAQLPPADPVP